jgi:HSP20 family protein
MTNLIPFRDPFAGLSSMHSQLDDLFNGFFGAGPSNLTSMSTAMDVYSEDGKRLVAEVQAPGFSKDDVEVSVHEGVLEIKGHKREKVEDGKEGSRNYMHRESAASFYRRIALPRHADAENVEANFDNGLLKVVVPFKELPQPKKIAIGDGASKNDKAGKKSK